MSTVGLNFTVARVEKQFDFQVEVEASLLMVMKAALQRVTSKSQTSALIFPLFGKIFMPTLKEMK